MTQPHFHSFKEALVDRFEQQILDAWYDSQALTDRKLAVPHVCEECDGLWDWYRTNSIYAPNATNLNWQVSWVLLGPRAVAQIFGLILLNDLRDGRWDHTESIAGMRQPFDQWELTFAALSQRQRWLVLKMLVWQYLNGKLSSDIETIRDLRNRMGFHESWPTPRRRPQT
jgi:hypothetical protein